MGLEGGSTVESAEINREDLRGYFKAERADLEDVYPEEDVPDDPSLFLRSDFNWGSGPPTIIYEDGIEAVVLSDSSTGSKPVLDTVNNEQYREIIERNRREEIRHELAHICHLNHHKDNMIARHQEAKHPTAAYLEALAEWEEQMAVETMAPFSLEEYGLNGLEDIPDFWDRFVSDEQDVTTVDDPHRFGVLSAYLVEQSYLQDYGLEEAKDRTRRDLLNVKGNSELEEVNREAIDRLSIPYFPDLIRGRNINYLDSELGELYLSDARDMI